MTEADLRVQKLEEDNLKLYRNLQQAVEQSRVMGLELQDLKKSLHRPPAPSASNWGAQPQRPTAPLPPPIVAKGVTPPPSHSLPRMGAKLFPPPPPVSSKPSLITTWNKDGRGIEKLVTVLGTFITLIGFTLFLIQGTEKEWLNLYTHMGIVVAVAALLLFAGNRYLKNKGVVSPKKI